VARRRGIPTASIHDLGVAACQSDLSIDGSIAPGPMDLAGVRYALVDPRLRCLRRDRRVGQPRPVVLVAFGGGSRRRLARAVAKAIGRRSGVAVRVAGGFEGRAPISIEPGIQFVPPRRTLAAELRGATVAVLAGGVTLYEACTMGVPAVAVSIVPAQRPAVAGLARRGAVIDAGAADQPAQTAARIAQHVADLLESPQRRRVLARAARHIVDGRGAERTAKHLNALIQNKDIGVPSKAQVSRRLVA
jgi:spore coat polysaccharide biosynthesis predicted glycosyltransferase SpsG